MTTHQDAPGVVATARLVWAARAEASRLHRLAVDSARLRADENERLEQMDARIYRCPGCGDWRYRTGHTGGRVRNSSYRVCACGYRDERTAVA